MDYLAEPWTSWTSARETKESGGMRMTWCLWGLDLNPKCNPWSKSSSTTRSRTVHQPGGAVEHDTAVQGAILTIKGASQWRDYLLTGYDPTIPTKK